MKTIKLSLIFILLISFGIGILFFEETFTFLIIGGSTALVLLVHLFGGYYLFKPSAPITKWQLPAILNGIAIASSLLLIFIKLLLNVQPFYPNIPFIIPVLLMLAYYTFRFINTKTEKKDKLYFSFLIVNNLIYGLLTVAILLIDGLSFSKAIYGTQSTFYLSARQKSLINEANTFSEKGDHKKVKSIIEKAIALSDSINDTGSINYKASIDYLGHTQYMLGEYNKADSLYNIILNSYKTSDLEQFVNSKPYYDVLFRKAKLHSNWSHYSLSDSLLHKCLNYYKNGIESAYIHQYLGNNQKNRENFDSADSLYNISLQLHKEKRFNKDPGYIYTLTSKANNYIDHSKYHSADSILNYSYSFTKEQFGSASKELTSILGVYVRLNIILGKYKVAEKYCLQNLEIKKANKNQQYMESILNLASIYMSLSYYYEADKLLKENILLIERKFSNNPPILCRFYDLMAQHHINLLDFDNAGSYAGKSINKVKSYYGNHHLKMAYSYDNLATVYYHKSQNKKAYSLYTEALGIITYNKKTESNQYWSSLSGKALVHIEQNQLDTAEQLINRCIEGYNKNIGTSHPYFASILSNKASLKIKQKKYTEAKELLLQSIKINKLNFEDRHISIGRAYKKLSAIDEIQNNIESSIRYLNKAVVIYSSVLGPNHKHVQQIEQRISNLENYQGK